MSTGLKFPPQRLQSAVQPDLPWQGLSVQIWLKVSRYHQNEQCCVRYSANGCPAWLAFMPAKNRSSCRTDLCVVGSLVGGLPGVRLLDRFAVKTSDDTVRRRVGGTVPLPQQQELIRHPGVDEVESYGAILVDLAEGRVVGTPPDRSADSLTWSISHHPTIEVIARDPGAVYSEVEFFANALGDARCRPLVLATQSLGRQERVSEGMQGYDPRLHIRRYPFLPWNILPRQSATAEPTAKLTFNHNSARGHCGTLTTVIEPPCAERLEKGDGQRPRW